MKKLEILLLAILGGFALTSLILSREYNSTAALFPRLIAIASLVFLSLTMFVGIRGRTPELFPVGNSSGVRPWIPWILVLQAGYVAFIYLLGFFVATLLYLILAPIQLGYQHRRVAIAASVVLTLLLAGSFMWLFEIQLPAGAIWKML